MFLDLKLNLDNRIKPVADDLFKKGYFVFIEQVENALEETTITLVVRKRLNNELIAIKPLANCKFSEELSGKQYETIVCKVVNDLQYLIDYPLSYTEQDLENGLLKNQRR